MGIDAVQKQTNASIFLHGMGPLGIEIAKNVVLSGVKKISIHDDRDVAESDLLG
jgi:molybdopterin/thiamine biosynthesis adenylyltransferase